MVSNLSKLARRARAAKKLLTTSEIGGTKPYSSAQYRILDAEHRVNDQRSVLFFTTHKCASTFVSEVLGLASKMAGFRHFDYAAGIYRLGDEVDTGDVDHTYLERIIERNAAQLFRKQGEIYGPLRRPIEFEGRTDLTQIFFLRDPRDVIVSSYYSFGFSHGLPPNSKVRKIFLADREKIKAEGIDAYSLRIARDWIEPTYRTYSRYLSGSENAFYFSYDEYKNDTRSFLIRIFEKMGILAPDEKLIDSLTKAAAPVRKVESQDGITHRRSGRSKQFLTELQDSTVAELNVILGDMLDFWKFER